MARFCALLVLAIAWGSDAESQYGEPTTSTTTTAAEPVCATYACPNGYVVDNPTSKILSIGHCCKYTKASVSSKLDVKAEKGDRHLNVINEDQFKKGDKIKIGPGTATEEENTVTGHGSLTLLNALLHAHPLHTAIAIIQHAVVPQNSGTTTPGPKPADPTNNGATTTSSKAVWYQRKEVKNGLIGGAAAAGLATFAGLGISAIVQANKATTPAPLLTTPWVAPTLAPTLAPRTFLITTPQIKAREETGSSISPLLIGLLTLLALCCCLGAIGFCVFMKTRKRSTKRKVSPPRHEETQPLVHEPVHAPPPPPPSGHYEQPMMMAPVTTSVPSYAPAATYMPTAALPTASMAGYTGLDMNRDGIPDAFQQPMGSMYAPATTQFAPSTSYATGSMYAPSSVYAPATTQYAGLGTSQYAPQNIV